MTLLSDDELENLSKLCRIKCTAEEQHRLAIGISKVLTYMEELQEVNTDSVDPCVHVMEFHTNVVREDEIEPTLDKEDFLSNSPAHVGGMVRVPPIIKPSKEKSH